MLQLSTEQMFSRYGSSTLFGMVVLAGLYASSFYNYLLFHSLVEIFSVIIALVIFVLAWNTRHIQDNHYLLFIGIASLFTGFLDLIHALAYKGMGIFPDHDANLPTQLWIAFRYVFSISMLLSPVFIKRKIHPERTFAIYLLVTLALFSLVFSGKFPDCFIEGRGLTPFKIISEYIISFIFTGALAILLYYRRSFDRKILIFMMLSLISSILSELCFTQYVSVYGLANLIGHYFEILACYFIYKAIIVTGIVEPSSLLFRTLKRSEEEYKAILSTTTDGFWLCDLHGRFIDTNETYCNLTGYTRNELLTMRIEDVEACESPEETDRHMQHLVEKGFDRFETRHKRKDGGVIDIEVSVTYVKGDGERLFIFLRDITERKRVEEEVQSLNRRLKHKIGELEAANQELESFSYSVSHDLRSPLRSIDGFSQALMEDYAEKLDAEGREYLDLVRSGSQRMARIIDDMLTLSRVIRSEMKRDQIDLGAMAHEIVDAYRKRDPERDITVLISEGLKANGDKQLVQLILENILNNAWKFTKTHPKARIEFGEIVHEGKRAFFIKDNGAGFDMAYIDKLFSPFQRLHSVNDFPGTGIGLATVKRIIQRHGGEVWMTGEVDKGATAYFTL